MGSPRLQSPSDTYRHADAALYNAKLAGRDRVVTAFGEVAAASPPLSAPDTGRIAAAEGVG